MRMKVYMEMSNNSNSDKQADYNNSTRDINVATTIEKLVNTKLASIK